jgi:anti-sigma B factor antagonist
MSCPLGGMRVRSPVDPEGLDMQAASISADSLGAVTIVLSGDIDFMNAAAVLESIRAGMPPGRPAGIRVDLSGVDFMDSSGMSVLVQILHLADDAGADLRVEQPNDKVRDQLHLSGLAEVLGVPGPPPRWAADPTTG